MISARESYRAAAHNTAPVFRPGSHSHNEHRLADQTPGRTARPLGWLQRFLLLGGLLCVGYYLYTLANQYVYQRYENWAFEQAIAGRTAVTFADYAREMTPLGLVLGKTSLPPASNRTAPTGRPQLVEGDLVGRVSIDRLHLSAVVREGVSDQTLSHSVGHIPATALPGGTGNFAIAAHRDTLFRALKDIEKGDAIRVESAGASYTYRVVATRIVKPSDVSVLRADGGGLSGDARPGPLLTMITCYPFYYVGAAPRRFIVEARLTPTEAGN